MQNVLCTCVMEYVLRVCTYRQCQAQGQQTNKQQGSPHRPIRYEPGRADRLSGGWGSWRMQGQSLRNESFRSICLSETWKWPTSLLKKNTFWSDDDKNQSQVQLVIPKSLHPFSKASEAILYLFVLDESLTVRCRQNHIHRRNFQSAGRSEKVVAASLTVWEQQLLSVLLK